jgi:hypothetical protein
VPAQGISSPDPDALRLELQEAIVTVRHWQTLGFQATGFIIAGNVVLLGYGFSQKQAGIFLLGSAVPMILLFVYLLTFSAAVRTIMLVIKLERDLEIRSHSLGATFARNLLGLTDADLVRLTDADLESFSFDNLMIHTPPIILYIASISQIILFVLCLTLFHYRLV